MKQSKGTKQYSYKQKPIKYKHETIYYVKDRKRYAGQITFCFGEGDHRKTVYGKSEREVQARLNDLKAQADAGCLESPEQPTCPTIYEYAEKMFNEQLALNEMLLSMFTGMRAGECCALMVEDIDLEKHTIHVSKTVARGRFGYNVLNETKTEAGNRILRVNDEVNELLRRIIGDKTEGMLFLSSNGNLVVSNQSTTITVLR